MKETFKGKGPKKTAYVDANDDNYCTNDSNDRRAWKGTVGCKRMKTA